MEINVRRAGMQTTVQDLGRRGLRASGVPLSGAMDPLALRIANALVGNPDGAAALEFAFVGPTVTFSDDVLIALGGAEVESVPTWRTLPVKAGETLALGPCVRGNRGYLAIAGGIDVEPVLGSRSTYLRAGFGGFEGRALRDGDVVKTGATHARAGMTPNPGNGGWRIDPRILPSYSEMPTVRVIRGAQATEFADVLLTTSFKVSPQSDRMGLRLIEGKLERSSALELLSSAVAPGTVQVPPDGQPLVLMADAQTIGGYPQVAHVIGVDLPLIAQLRPGDGLRFIEVTVAEAHRLARQREHALAVLREGLAEKIGRSFLLAR